MGVGSGVAGVRKGCARRRYLRGEMYYTINTAHIISWQQFEDQGHSLMCLYFTGFEGQEDKTATVVETPVTS